MFFFAYSCFCSSCCCSPIYFPCGVFSALCLVSSLCMVLIHFHIIIIIILHEQSLNWASLTIFIVAIWRNVLRKQNHSSTRDRYLQRTKWMANKMRKNQATGHTKKKNINKYCALHWATGYDFIRNGYEFKRFVPYILLLTIGICSFCVRRLSTLLFFSIFIFIFSLFFIWT